MPPTLKQLAPLVIIRRSCWPKICDSFC